MKIKQFIIVIFFLFVSIPNIFGENMINADSLYQLKIKDIPQEKWNMLSQKKIFFGHNSVGNNILTGIKHILKEYPNIKIKIITTRHPDDFKEPILGHSWIGSNMEPISKTRAFENIIQGGLGGKVDIAVMKMCYVDITSKTKIKEVFFDYQQKLSKMEVLFPEIKFIHMTVPLTSKPEGIQFIVQKGKNIIKKIIGRPVFNYKDNINRNTMNDMYREAYDDNTSLFDLALLESVENKKESVYIKNDIKIRTLTKKYTDDGGHLNIEGSKQIAEQFLIFLANLE